LTSPDQALLKSDSTSLNPRQFALLLGLLVGICFPTVLIGVDTFFFRDYAFFGYPLAAYHRESFWAGEIPLWNPYNNAGIPFLAQWNTMVLYPGSLIYLLLPLPWSLSLFCIAHFYLAGVGMYQLARQWTGENIPAAIAGIAFPFSGLVLCCLKWPNNIAALGWMPLVILGVQQAWRNPRAKLISAVLFGSMQMLTGAPEIILFTWAILGVLWLSECIKARNRLTMAITFPLVVAAVAALSAAQLLPFLELLFHSQRDRHFGGAMWPMPLSGFANFIVPIFNTITSYHGVPAQPGQYWISTYYLALPILVLATCALLLRREYKVWVLAGCGFLALLLSLGTDGLLYDWIRKALPFLSFMRFPVKFLTVTIFVLPLLAAFGAQAVLSSRKMKSVGWVFVAFAAAPLAIALLSFNSPDQFHHTPAVWKNAFFRTAFLLVFVSGILRFINLEDPSRRGFFGLIFCVVIWGDAVTHSPWQNPTAPSWVYLGKGAELHPSPQLGESRALISAEASDKLDHLIFDSAHDDVLASRLSLYANANLLEAIPKVDGFFALYLQHMHQVEKLIYTRGLIPGPLLDFLGVSHLTAPGKTRTWEKRPTAMPWLSAGQTPLLLSDADALMRIAAADFNPHLEVTLPEGSEIKNVKGGNVHLHSSRISAHEWLVEVEATKPGLIVFSHAYHPHWRARLNNEAVPVWRANVAFQAVAVPEGRHYLHLKYVDNWFKAGAIISTLTLGFLLVLGRIKLNSFPASSPA
jgi:hypothetical protein